MKSTQPQRAYVRAEISIHSAVDAVEHFAANYPEERLDTFTAGRLIRAARLIIARAAAYQLRQILPAGSKLKVSDFAYVPGNKTIGWDERNADL